MCCIITDFSTKDEASSIKFCSAVHWRPRQGITHFVKLCSLRNPKSDESASTCVRWPKDSGCERCEGLAWCVDIGQSPLTHLLLLLLTAGEQLAESARLLCFWVTSCLFQFLCDVTHLLVQRLQPAALHTTYVWVTDYCQPTTVTAGRTRLRSANTQQLAVPRTNTGYGDRSFAVSGPSVWNSLPTALRMSDCSLTTFRTQLKTLLFIWYIVYRRPYFLTAGQRICGLRGILCVINSLNNNNNNTPQSLTACLTHTSSCDWSSFLKYSVMTLQLSDH